MNGLMSIPFSRRHFLQTAGATAAIWVPAPVNGYSASEVSNRAAAHGSELSELGISLWDLDTPALVVDLDALEGNLEVMQRVVGENGICLLYTSDAADE